MSVIDEDIRRLAEENPELINELKNKSFLITGATGMIGQYTSSLLLEIAQRYNTNNSITLCVRNESRAMNMFSKYVNMDQFNIIIGDITDIKDVDSDIDYILHAASPTQPQDFLENPVGIIRSNVNATDNLLILAQKKNARFCLLSTLEVYGAIEAGKNTGELTSVSETDFGALDSLNLRSTYPESKRLAENLCIAFKQQYGVKSTIIRLAPAISPIISPHDKRVFAQFINSVIDNNDITVYSDAADKKRSYTYIADVVSGILLGIVKSTDDNFVFNLANNNNVVSIKELAEIIISETPESTSSLNVITRDKDTNSSTSTGVIQLDSRKLISIGWHPSYSINESIGRIVSANR